MEDTSSSICNSYTELAEVFRMTGGLLFRGLTSAQEYVHFVQPVLQLQLKFRSISRQSSQRCPQQYKKIHFNVNFIGFEYMNNCCFSMKHCNSPLQNNQFAGRAALKKNPMYVCIFLRGQIDFFLLDRDSDSSIAILTMSYFTRTFR